MLSKSPRQTLGTLNGHSCKAGKTAFLLTKNNPVLFQGLSSGFRSEAYIPPSDVHTNTLSKGYIPLTFSMNVDAMTAMFFSKSFISSLAEGKKRKRYNEHFPEHKKESRKHLKLIINWTHCCY